MSRIGKKPIAIPSGVKISQSGGTVKVSGPQGNLELQVHPEVEAQVESERIVVTNPRPNSRRHRALHGTMRALLANMVEGVSKGFEQKMQVFGAGFNVKEQGGKLVLQVGYSHPVEVAIPDSVKVTIQTAATRGDDVPATFTLASPDKRLLGQLAANIRAIRPPEPYKGKGIRYADEVVRRKAGKAFASAAM